MTIVQWCGTVNSWRGGNVTGDISVCSIPPRLGIGFLSRFFGKSCVTKAREVSIAHPRRDWVLSLLPVYFLLSVRRIRIFAPKNCIPGSGRVRLRLNTFTIIALGGVKDDRDRLLR